MEDSNPVDAGRAVVAALNNGDIQRYLGSFDPSCLRRVAGLDQPPSLADVRNGREQLITTFEDRYLHEVCCLATGNSPVLGGG
jgi:hypothetical protein